MRGMIKRVVAYCIAKAMVGIGKRLDGFAARRGARRVLRWGRAAIGRKGLGA